MAVSSTILPLLLAFLSLFSTFSHGAALFPMGSSHFAEPGYMYRQIMAQPWTSIHGSFASPMMGLGHAPMGLQLNPMLVSCGLMGMCPSNIQQQLMGTMITPMSSMMCSMGMCPASIPQSFMSTMQLPMNYMHMCSMGMSPASILQPFMSTMQLPMSYMQMCSMGMCPENIQQQFMSAMQLPMSNMRSFNYLSGSYAPSCLSSVGMMAY